MASATVQARWPVDLALSNLRPPAGSRVTTALAAHHWRTGCAPWRNFLWITRRSTTSIAGDMSLDPCSMRHSMARGNRWQNSLALEIVDTPAVEGESRDVILPVELGDLVRDGLRIGRRSDRRNAAKLGPGVVGSVILLTAPLQVTRKPTI